MPDTEHFRKTTRLPGLLPLCKQALRDVDAYLENAKTSVAEMINNDPKQLETQQFAAHGLSWLATYVSSLHQLANWAEMLDTTGRLGEIESLILQIGFGEYLAQLSGGIPMSQGEISRPADLGLVFEIDDASSTLISQGNSDPARLRLVQLMQEAHGQATFGETGLDEDNSMIRDQFRRFAQEKIVPHAHEWHLSDELIPSEILDSMAELGVFGLTIPEEFGGIGMGKITMCVVSEELSRGYIGVGSLGTRTEIAAELILGGGTDAQKAEWLPKLASGEILPTAVFTEPDTGSDLAALKTRAIKDGGDWVLKGNKTWITHAGRTDLMTVLARTDTDSKDHRGLSMFLAPKTRGTVENPFPDPTIDGGEIEVLGYRGMKEYTLALDNHRIPNAALLGGVEGMGFRQLMQTFESARIQTAARAIGVAQNALELGLQYAQDRKAFGKALVNFPRVYSKLAMMAVEIMITRQLTYHSAREKDAGRRCDLEAGMAKLLAARVAWAAADNSLQIHGGNGFALEYPISRVLCDARILNIFEGAAEIQAQVIARRLIEKSELQ